MKAILELEKQIELLKQIKKGYNGIVDIVVDNLVPIHLELEAILTVQPTVSNAEVEEALRGLEYMGDKDLYNGVHIQIKNTIKTNFQQMQQEIEVEKRNYLRICEYEEELAKENNQYKQLLNKIELSEDSLGWYIKVGTEREYTPFEVYNILKELKSIGEKNKMLKKYKVDYDGVFIEVKQPTVSNEEALEALKKLLNHCIITTTSREQIKVLKIYNTIKAELDKLDRIKEMIQNMMIEFDELGFEATTTTPNTNKEIKERYFAPIQKVLGG